MISRQVDGFLVAPAETSFESLTLIQEQNKAIVLLDRHIEADEVNIIRGDSDGGAYLLTKHLLDLQSSAYCPTQWIRNGINIC